MITLNKKEYNDTGIFKNKYIEEYCNLNIYPLINELETEAGLMSEFAEAFKDENTPATFDIYGNDTESIQFLKDNLLNFVEKSEIVIGYIDYPIKQVDNLRYIHVLLAPENDNFNNFFNKVKINGLSKVLYLSELGETIFKKYFWYYFKESQFNYNNLICYTMIIKNGGSLLEKVLTENLNSIDRWCILDTG